MVQEKTVKIYLMATPASGKTYFARNTAPESGIRVVDFSRERLDDGSPGDYHRKIVRFLEECEEPVCVLGRRGPKDVSVLEGVQLGVVLPPRDEHLALVQARANLNRTIDRWTRVTEIDRARDQLRRYAGKRGIPIFSSFEEALARLLRCGEGLRQRD